MCIYLVKLPTQRKVRNEQPLPQAVVFAEDPNVIKAHAEQRELSRTSTIDDFIEKKEIDLERLPSYVIKQLEQIAHSFYKSYL